MELLVESCVKSIRQMRQIREYQAELEKAYMQTIETLRYVVETRDRETRGHSERVSLLGVALAKELGMNEQEENMIRVAGLFHDIGKVGVPDAILLKNGSLTKEEFEQIKHHPIEGERILASYAPFKDTLPIVRGHHERYDGSGYPDGIAGEEINLGARIIAVADSFDAMISNRTYRAGLGLDKTLAELVAGKGTQFDAKIVDALLAFIEKEGRDKFQEEFCTDRNR